MMKERITQVKNESQNNLIIFQETNEKLQVKTAESEEEEKKLRKII